MASLRSWAARPLFLIVGDTMANPAQPDVFVLRGTVGRIVRAVSVFAAA